MRGVCKIRPKDDIAKLEQSIPLILKKAQEFKLDFYEMRFEICPAEIIYTFGAYGMPTRFSHWSHGKSYHKLKTQYDYNLSRIYELVINSDPCYAFLLEGNSLIQNQMVVAHVLAHCDFFKNNAYFQTTNAKDILEVMSVAAERFRNYEMKYGRKKVEDFLDAALALQEHVEPRQRIKKAVKSKKEKGSCHKPATPYDDLWDLDQKAQCKCAGECQRQKKIPVAPEKDIMLFIMNYGKELEGWQRDILSVLRDEMLYFWPQMETKIMNEGWASYWHLRIMREMDISEADALEFAKMHAGVVLPSTVRLNPYLLGLKIFEDIEKRWDKEEGAGAGREKIFEVREIDNDISFIRNYLTKELVEKLDLYIYKKSGHDWKITDKEWEKVRDELVAGMTNGGIPYIVVEDGDYGKKGELYLKHYYDGRELDVQYLEKTLQHLQTLWGRQVHLETIIDNKPILFSCNSERSIKKFL